MAHYRTEVIIPPDRYLCLKLPDRIPEGRATVTVRVHEPEMADSADPLESDLDHEDIEWWEEFEDDQGPLGPL